MKGRFDIGLSIVAQHGVIKIALFQKGLNNCSFQGVWKSPRKKWGVHTSKRSASKQSSTLLKKDVGSVSR